MEEVLPTYGPFYQWNGVGNNNQGPRENTRCAQSGNGAADDQRLRRWRGATDSGTDLKYANCDKKNPLDGKEGIKFAKYQLSRGSGQ